jgi:hypothetical protein
MCRPCHAQIDDALPYHPLTLTVVTPTSPLIALILRPLYVEVTVREKSDKGPHSGTTIR